MGADNRIKMLRKFNQMLLDKRPYGLIIRADTKEDAEGVAKKLFELGKVKDGAVFYVDIPEQTSTSE